MMENTENEEKNTTGDIADENDIEDWNLAEEMKDLSNKINITNKNLSTTNNKIDYIYSILDNLSREQATKIVHNISDDNPDLHELNQTYATITSRPPIPITSNILSPKTTTEQYKGKL